jgi:formamidopyrimidine-DNA glycosylase
MPEMIEVERYRQMADRTVGRRIAEVRAPDAWFLKHGTTARVLRAALTGRSVAGTRRIGKLLLLHTDGPTLGLRFGMTGRLLLDGVPAYEKIEYTPMRIDPAWIRFGLSFEGGGALDLLDPRRLGGVELEPDESRLGPDALAFTPARFRAAVGASRAPVKAWLLDQVRIAGVGNLIADEALWRAGIDPARPGATLSPEEATTLHRTLQRTIKDLTRRGGSHMGDLQVARTRGADCPRDGAPLLRRTIGGRTTYSCPRHQR